MGLQLPHNFTQFFSSSAYKDRPRAGSISEPTGFGEVVGSGVANVDGPPNRLHPAAPSSHIALSLLVKDILGKCE